MSYTIGDLGGTPNALAEHYNDFNVADRLLLTGHSHQAWPDVAFHGIRESYEDAAGLVDGKWEKAFAKAQEVREYFSRLLEDEDGYIALAPSTHDLLIRFLSALPLKEKPKLVTTDGEFHTMRRQLARLGEEGVEICRVPSYPVASIADRIIDELDNRVSAVLVSSVFFETGLINPGLKAVAEKCTQMGIELLVDAYHSINVAPFSIKSDNLQRTFVLGGGYKYCQLGEGNCFMRFPKDFNRKPVVTGWFSEFSLLEKKPDGTVQFGEGSDLFAGSTYDPVSHYRAVEVFKFFSQHELTPAFLRQVSRHQVSLMLDEFRKLDLPKDLIHADESVDPESRAGFLVLFSGQAAAIHDKLESAGVLTDYRGSSLRFGPAPYLSDQQLKDAIGMLGEVCRE